MFIKLRVGHRSYGSLLKSHKAVYDRIVLKYFHTIINLFAKYG